MKEINFKNGKVITTPWLRIEEAAAYCGLSRSAFNDHSSDLPHSGGKRTRLYHVNVLDAWLEGTLDVPFDPLPAHKHRRRSPTLLQKEELAMIDPISGKVFQCHS